ncbi:hypothetical protein CLOM_g18079 [Closterium sp. NIES-68]|nr:hypothetical protein CLOM_g18079 [Closterium sp. NIES-68]GJP65556.1 hypothetical protein CLOP_g22432 [Closterium sp. NIES-67]
MARREGSSADWMADLERALRSTQPAVQHHGILAAGPALADWATWQQQGRRARGGGKRKREAEESRKQQQAPESHGVVARFNSLVLRLADAFSSSSSATRLCILKLLLLHLTTAASPPPPATAARATLAASAVSSPFPAAWRREQESSGMPDVSSMCDVSLLQWRWRREGERRGGLWRGRGARGGRGGGGDLEGREEGQNRRQWLRCAERAGVSVGCDPLRRMQGDEDWEEGCHGEAEKRGWDDGTVDEGDDDADVGGNSASSTDESGDGSASSTDESGDGSASGSDGADADTCDAADDGDDDWAGVLTPRKLLNPNQVITRIAPLLARSFPSSATATATAAAAVAAGTAAAVPQSSPAPPSSHAASAVEPLDALQSRCLALRLIGCLAPLAAGVAHVQEMVVRAMMGAEGREERHAALFALTFLCDVSPPFALHTLPLLLSLTLPSSPPPSLPLSLMRTLLNPPQLLLQRAQLQQSGQRAHGRESGQKRVTSREPQGTTSMPQPQEKPLGQRQARFHSPSPSLLAAMHMPCLATSSLLPRVSSPLARWRGGEEGEEGVRVRVAAVVLKCMAGHEERAVRRLAWQVAACLLSAFPFAPWSPLLRPWVSALQAELHF